MEPLIFAILHMGNHTISNLILDSDGKTWGIAYVHIVALNHRAKANIIAKAVPWFIGIDGIAFVIHLLHLHLCDLALFLLHCPRLPLGRRFSLAYCAGPAAARDTNNARGGTLRSFRRNPSFGNWGVAGCAGSTRSVGS